MKKLYMHLTFDERDKLLPMLWDKLSIREMARRLGRDPSTISREIKRNTPPLRKVYTPHLAQANYQLRKKTARQRPRLKNQMIVSCVKEKLKLQWSPEQIAGRWNKHHKNLTISHEAIYQYIYTTTKPGDPGDLRIYLRRKHKRRQRKYIQFKMVKTTIPNRVFIDLRPSKVTARKQIGHWEGDSMVSKKSKVGLNTLAGRKSRLVRISKLEQKTALLTCQAVTNSLKDYPAKAKQTLTMDNGTENSKHEQITKELGIKCYFAHPYHSWERGTNENTNGLIRYYFPKGTDFAKISDEEIKIVENLLNNRPRKCLKFATPLEVFNQACCT